VVVIHHQCLPAAPVLFRFSSVNPLHQAEVQNISGWEVWLRRLVDTERVQIAVTGSSAKLLSREIATALRGRSLSTEMFPFCFREA